MIFKGETVKTFFGGARQAATMIGNSKAVGLASDALKISSDIIIEASGAFGKTLEGAFHAICGDKPEAQTIVEELCSDFEGLTARVKHNMANMKRRLAPRHATVESAAEGRILQTGDTWSR